MPNSFDFLSLGALVHRLDPGIIPFRKAAGVPDPRERRRVQRRGQSLRLLPDEDGIATAMVDYPIGDLIAERVRAMGVKPFYKRFEHDGVTGPNMATVYSDRGQGVRAAGGVLQPRPMKPRRSLKPGDFDWKAIFAQGVRWFHSGGIFAALSPTTGGVGHRSNEGGEGGGRGGFVRLELSREALEYLGRRGARE